MKFIDTALIHIAAGHGGLRTGQPLTDAEKTRMDEWGDSLEAKPAAGTAGAADR